MDNLVEMFITSYDIDMPESNSLMKENLSGV